MRSDASDLNSPFAYATCDGSTPSSSAASALPSSISFWAARKHTLPAPTVLREPPVPLPFNFVPGGHCASFTFSSGIPSASAMIDPNVVSCPWPCALATIAAVTVPLASS